MEQPEGFAEDQTKVCKLCKVMKKKGCEASEADPCIYTKKERDSFVTFSVYVDDVILASNDTNLFKREKIYLTENFNNVDQCEIYYIHGMAIERYRENGTLRINKYSYLHHVFGFTTSLWDERL